VVRGNETCGHARRDVARIERGHRGDWACSRGIHVFELSCRRGGVELQVLEHSPYRAHVHAGIVRLANWSFRFHDGGFEGRSGGRWIVLARGAPVCVDAVPREALLAFRLRPVTPSGGCFAAPTS
jgi:hypothetical protein